MDCHFLLQGVFLTQGSNLGLSQCRQTLYHLSHQGSRTSKKLGGKPHLHMAPLFLLLKLGSAKAPSQRCWTERNETAEGFSYPLPIPFPSLPGGRETTKVAIPAPAAPKPHQLMTKSLYKIGLFYCFLLFFLASLHGMWDLSPSTRDQTWVPCMGRAES